jgi:hypothetical protein
MPYVEASHRWRYNGVLEAVRWCEEATVVMVLLAADKVVKVKGSLLPEFNLSRLVRLSLPKLARPERMSSDKSVYRGSCCQSPMKC